jgi:hypothetical protein
MNTMKTLAVAVALVASAGAQAAVTFNFKAPSVGSEASFASKVFTSGGITVTVTAGSAVDSTPRVWSDIKGLGVSDSDSGGQVEGGGSSPSAVGNGESLLFTFSQAVTIGNIGFEDWEDNSNTAKLTYQYGIGGTGNTIITGEGDISDANDIYSLALGGAITWMRVSALTEVDGSGVSDFYVWQMGDVAAAPAVPVPAAAWLMGSGLIGLTAVARRRRA